MQLPSGSRLGSYEVVEPIGKGGMGEVYRGRDTALGRDVALKVLPESFAGDADRLARFDREAQALASLNHPNIAQVYAIETVAAGAGSSQIGRAIVMELVEGEDLSQRIARGPISLEDALPIARQIALALEAAHEAGIIHRDLKPANIKVRPDGTAKVLDFGLAKAFGGDATASASSLANSPTLTARATELGVVLGTAAYMAPEQAKGRAVDRRADVWAFGAVLYEMLAGRRAFVGDDVTEVMAAVIRDTPDFGALPVDTPVAVRRLLRRCLEKDARKRMRDMGDVGVELDEAMAGPTGDAPAVAETAPRRSPVPFAGAAIVLALVTAAAAWTLKPTPVVERPVARFAITLDEGQRLNNINNPNLAWSHDGRVLAYRADGVIYVRTLDDPAPRALVESAGNGQRFSHDGQMLFYRNPYGISKVPVTGGPSLEVVKAADVSGFDVAEDGSLVWSDGATIKRISGPGAAPTTLVTAPQGGGAFLPQVLPGGGALLFTRGVDNEIGVVVQRLDDPNAEPLMLVPGAIGGYYSPSGHLVYGSDGRLLAVPFDVSQLKVTGSPVALPEAVAVGSGGFAQFAISGAGSFAYVEGEAAQQLQLWWVDDQGRSQPAVTVFRNYSDVVLSPDGRRAAAHLWDQDNDIWVADLVRGGLTRLTFTSDEEETPVWSPDGTEIAYAAPRNGDRGLFVRAADGSAAATERMIWKDPDHFHVNDWSRDGRTFIVEVNRADTGNDILAVDKETGTSRTLLASPYPEYSARLSPDGKWLAYVSDESGRPEVFVQPYPAMNLRVAVSTDGGREPVWARDGRRLYFRSSDSVMAAAVTTTAPLEFAVPKVLFRDIFVRTQGTYHTHFDVASDGRFLMVGNPNSDKPVRAEIQVVLNWADTLTRLAPPNR